VLFIVIYVTSFQGGGAIVKTFILGVELQQESDGRWSVWVPGLPGCASWGHTKEEALHNIKDAAEVYIEDLLEAGQEIPLQGVRIEVRDEPVIAVTV
jgi:predicted RNase H-like HicB family nuclease